MEEPAGAAPIRISVVIPTYNRATRVMGAVESVLRQSVPVHEVVVVDDGSTDGTPALFSDLHSKVRYIRKRNGGVSSARNAGVLAAGGDWIAFLDSDDTWHPDKIARQLACLEETGAKVCFSSGTDETGTPIDDLRRMFPGVPEGGFGAVRGGDPVIFSHPRHPGVISMLARRDILIAAGLFDESLRVAEDTKLIYRLCLDHGFAVVVEPLVNLCRKRAEKGLSDDDRPGIAAERYECYARVQSEFYWPMLSRDPATARIIRSNLGYFLSRRAELACALGDDRTARLLGREAFHFGTDPKTRLRGALAMAVPFLCRGPWRKKWRIHQDV